LAVRLPHPPRGGSDLRTWQMVNALAALGEVAVFGLRSQPAVDPPRADISAWQSSDDESIGDREAAAPAALAWLRDPEGHPYDRFLTPRGVADLEALVDQFRPDVAVLEGLAVHRYLASLRGRLPVVFDAHDVEGRLHGEIAETQGKLPAVLLARLAERARIIEAAALEDADQVWVCSDDDAGRIAEDYGPDTPLVVVPNTVDVERYAAPRRERELSVVFPGRFGYPPNARAALWLVEGVLPMLSRRFPDARVVLLGTEPTSEMLAAAERDSRVIVTGSVPEVGPFLASAGAMAIPLFEGGGTRFKVLEAFASGLPVVSTAKGVEGLAVTEGAHFVHAETPQEFAEEIARVWSDQDLAKHLRDRGLALVRERYSWDAAAERVRGGLRRLGLTETTSSTGE
jgi:glycosyltransferase involved in cell wall biosynthesis